MMFVVAMLMIYTMFSYVTCDSKKLRGRSGREVRQEDPSDQREEKITMTFDGPSITPDRLYELETRNANRTECLAWTPQVKVHRNKTAGSILVDFCSLDQHPSIIPVKTCIANIDGFDETCGLLKLGKCSLKFGGLTYGQQYEVDAMAYCKCLNHWNDPCPVRRFILDSFVLTSAIPEVDVLEPEVVSSSKLFIIIISSAAVFAAIVVFVFTIIVYRRCKRKYCPGSRSTADDIRTTEDQYELSQLAADDGHTTADQHQPLQLAADDGHTTADQYQPLQLAADDGHTTADQYQPLQLAADEVRTTEDRDELLQLTADDGHTTEEQYHPLQPAAAPHQINSTRPDVQTAQAHRPCDMNIQEEGIEALARSVGRGGSSTSLKVAYNARTENISGSLGGEEYGAVDRQGERDLHRQNTCEIYTPHLNTLKDPDSTCNRRGSDAQQPSCQLCLRASYEQTTDRHDLVVTNQLQITRITVDSYAMSGPVNQQTTPHSPFTNHIGDYGTSGQSSQLPGRDHLVSTTTIELLNRCSGRHLEAESSNDDIIFNNDDDLPNGRQSPDSQNLIPFPTDLLE